MKTNDIEYIMDILIERMDASVLCDTTYIEDTSEDMLQISGEPEIISECMVNIYNSLYEYDPNELLNYIITTEPVENELRLTVKDIKK